MKKKKYIHKVIFENQSKEIELVEKHRQQILKEVRIIMENSFDFDMTLHIWIRDEFNSGKNYLKGEIEDAFSTKKGKQYVICLKTDVIRKIEKDNGLDACTAITHELSHIYDLYNILHNKYYKFNPLKSSQRNIFDYISMRGWWFWTEFFAYYHTFKRFYHFSNFPTFLSLVKLYEQLQIQSDKVNHLYQEDAPCRDEKAYELLNQIDSLVYGLAKFLAGQIAGKTKYIKYSEKTTRKESFKYVERLCDGLMRHVAPIFANTYGKGMPRKLYNIGRYIFKNIHMKLSFGVDIIDKEARIYVWVKDDYDA